MKSYIKFIFIQSLGLAFIAMVSMGCESNSDSITTSEIYSPTSSPAKIICVVLCDLTTSVEESSIKKIARDAYELVKVLPEGAQVEFYQIDDNPFIPPILSYTKPLRPTTRPSEVRKYPLRLEKEAKQVGEMIYQHAQKIKYKTSASIAKSCILTGFKTAHGVLKQYPREEYDWELIVLSDMIEECNNSPVGNVYFTHKGYGNARKKLQSYTPKYDLGYANLSIIVSASYQPKDLKYLHPDKLKELWQIVFEKVGYSKEQLDSIYFGPKLPYRLTKHN